MSIKPLWYIATVASISIAAPPALAAQKSIAELKNDEEAALKAYEAAHALRLGREIAEEEQALAAKKAEYAKLKASAAAPKKPMAAEGAQSASTAPIEAVQPADVADAAAKTNTKIVTETTVKGDTKTEKTTVTPLSQAGLRDGPGKREFGGITFGVGLAYTLDLGRLQRVKEAELVNKIVRVKQSEQSSARIVLESHYFLTPVWDGINNFMRNIGVSKNEYIIDEKTGNERISAGWGIGPFVALQPGTDNIIDAIGTGLMIGARRPGGNDSFNLGIGLMVDIDARTLGNGIIEDQPLPEGEMTIRYKQRSQLGLLLMSSYSF